MENIKFYKEADTGNWVCGRRAKVPAGTCSMEVNDDKTYVSIIDENKEQIASGYITDFVKESGDHYVDYTEFNTEINDFFDLDVEATSELVNLYEAITTGNQATKILDISNSQINPATSTDIANVISALQTSGGATFRAFSVEITRTNSAVAYTAGQVVADVTAAFKPFVDVAKVAGAGVKIIRVRIQTSDTGCAGKKFNLHLYNEAPTFISDYSSFAINYANVNKRVGAIPVVMGTGSLGTVGYNDWNHMICNPVNAGQPARNMYFILESVDGFTPSAVSTKFTVVIDCELSNS